MITAEPHAVHLRDYRPPQYSIPEIALDFVLAPDATRVTASMKVVRSGKNVCPLVLNGKSLSLKTVRVNGKTLKNIEYAYDPHQLTLHSPPASFTLELVTEIGPAKNTALEGLYISNGIYCTQCEPEGFRAITYYLDRPDNLAKFTTRIEALEENHPVLLSNGNLIDSGRLPGGRHFALWEDPFPKPSYLFALVAGDLASIGDDFITQSERKVILRIYVEHGNEERAYYAMGALKRAMRWDEVAYGREYDLDIFMIVAVSAFNFGAMENKGLNIFNDKVLLASPETATDDDYARIESVVGHEYFHNWTGDRITCRDWFQLSLKEGLTVFRESGFAGDMRSHAVRRIADVKDLRLRQFQEDSGPLAHPVQPQSYIAIDNFYTATVYEKGAEVIGMLKTIVGPADFRKGMELYFTRHDGKAATVEDFVCCFEVAAGRNLEQFRLWYQQAGTPEITVRSSYDTIERVYRLKLVQNLAPTPGQPTKEPMHIPLVLGLIGKQSKKPLALTFEGENQSGPDERVVELTRPSQEYVFTNVDEEPILSIGRNFSAPVRIDDSNGRAALAFIVRHDTDLFSRWDAAQRIATSLILEFVDDIRANLNPEVDSAYLEAIGEIINRAGDDPAFTAQVLVPPCDKELVMAMRTIDPEAIHAARRYLIAAVGTTHERTLAGLYRKYEYKGAFSPDAVNAGRRDLRNAALRFLTANEDTSASKFAYRHFRDARNMTDMIAGLAALTRIGGADCEAALSEFHERFRSDPLALDKWMALQAMAPQPDTAAKVRALMHHPSFSLKNPNRVRALIGAFANNNPFRFHDISGSGYRLVREVVEMLDALNPQIAARMVTAFENWRRYDSVRQGRIRKELEVISLLKPISPNLFEVTTKILGTSAD